MNKFKKILLGALSVLTLGLFCVVGTKVEAATVSLSADTLLSGTCSDERIAIQTSGCDSTVKTGTFSGKNCTGSWSSRLNKGTVTITTTESANITSYTYAEKGKTISIDGTVVHSLTESSDKGVYEDTKSSATSFEVAVSGSSCGVCEIKVEFDDSSSESKTFTLKYDLNGGTSAVAIDDATYTDNEAPLDESHEFTVSSTEPTRSNFTFLGWSTTSTGSVEYKAEDKIEVTSTTTLYAVWEYNGNPNLLDEDTISAFISGTAVSSKTYLNGLNYYISNTDKSTTQKISNVNTTVLNLGSSGHPSTENNYESNPKAVLGYQANANGSLTIEVYHGTSERTWNVVNVTDNDSVVENQVISSGSVEEIRFNVVSGKTYEIYANNSAYIVSANFSRLADNVSASVFAEKNPTGTKLRFVGTLTGITDLTKIDKIELLLKKDNVAANPISLTTCYTSVTGLSDLAPACDGGTNIYYVIFRLSGINNLSSGTKINKQLKVAFTDGSYTLSDASDITL